MTPTERCQDIAIRFAKRRMRRERIRENSISPWLEQLRPGVKQAIYAANGEIKRIAKLLGYSEAHSREILRNLGLEKLRQKVLWETHHGR